MTNYCCPTGHMCKQFTTKFVILRHCLFSILSPSWLLTFFQSCDLIILRLSKTLHIGVNNKNLPITWVVLFLISRLLCGVYYERRQAKAFDRLRMSRLSYIQKSLRSSDTYNTRRCGPWLNHMCRTLERQIGYQKFCLYQTILVETELLHAG